MPGTPYEKAALYDVSLEIQEGETLGIIGATGSGKSTFIQHLNGLIKLSKKSKKTSSIRVFDINLNVRKPDYRTLRQTVGLVFQYPEYQLFDETVAKDVGFGPRNLKLPKEKIDERVKQAIELVGLDYSEVAEKSPFELSGGQKRRAAIAGVIAMRPRVLILDEPTAGLDPRGKREILDLIQKFKMTCPTIIIISHDMDEIAAISDRIAVFEHGRIVYHLPPKELFGKASELQEMGLDIPATIKIANALKSKKIDLKDIPVRKSELAHLILNKYEGRK